MSQNNRKMGKKSEKNCATMHEMNSEDLKDFIGRIIKDEPNY